MVKQLYTLHIWFHKLGSDFVRNWANTWKGEPTSWYQRSLQLQLFHQILPQDCRCFFWVAATSINGHIESVVVLQKFYFHVISVPAIVVTNQCLWNSGNYSRGGKRIVPKFKGGGGGNDPQGRKHPWKLPCKSTIWNLSCKVLLTYHLQLGCWEWRCQCFSDRFPFFSCWIEQISSFQEHIWCGLCENYISGLHVAYTISHRLSVSSSVMYAHQIQCIY